MKDEKIDHSEHKVKVSKESNEIKKIVLAKPKGKESVWLQYTGSDDLRELIRFTGTKPRINEDGTMKIRKYDLIPPCLINCDHQGNIKDVLSWDEFKDQYEVIGTKVYTESFTAPKVRDLKE